MRQLNLHRLSARAHSIRLFFALGSKIDDARVRRIHAWHEWPGPEDPLVMEMGDQQQALHDAKEAELDQEQWNEALRVVVSVANELVPYEEDQDAWYAPNTAVWCAAWTLALEEAHVAKNVPIPLALSAQLHWYEQGHWPCGLTALGSESSALGYVVY
jgi:hypothetical protein